MKSASANVTRKPRRTRSLVVALSLCMASACSVDNKGLSSGPAGSSNADASIDGSIKSGSDGTGGFGTAGADGGTVVSTSTGGTGNGLSRPGTGGSGGDGNGGGEGGFGGTFGLSSTGGMVGSGGNVSGTAGNEGTGGLVATGGVSGLGGDNGGSSGAAGSPARLVVKYTCRDPHLVEAISFKLRLVNKTSLPIPLTSVKVRYWFTFASPASLVLACDYAAIQFPRGTCADILHTSAVRAVTPPRGGANAYLEIGFDAGAGSLDAFRDDAANDQMILRLSDPSGVPIDQSDDYSYDCSKPDTEIEPQRITAYVGGSLVFGREPP